MSDFQEESFGSGLDLDELAATLRNRAINPSRKEILITQFHGTQQGLDVSKINCDGYGRIHRYNKPSSTWSPEPIPEEPAAWRLGMSATETQVAQLFQISVCDFRCWYCFVDRASLSGLSKSARFMTTDELVELYLRDSDSSRVIVLTGGQPDITPEWTFWMMHSLEKFGLSNSTYLWQDDNLSCGYTWRYLTPEQREFIRSYANYGRCCCLKSFTAQGFSETTGTAPRFFDRQFELLKKLVSWGVDVYVYLTLTTSTLLDLKSHMARFMDRLQQEVHPNVPLRVVPLEIKRFTPTEGRITPMRDAAIENQYHALQAWQEELHLRFSSQELETPIYEVVIR